MPKGSPKTVSLARDMKDLALRAKRASLALAKTGRKAKDRVLAAVARDMRAGWRKLEAANAADVRAAKRSGLAGAMLDRLRLDRKRVSDMADSVQAVCRLRDPVGQVMDSWRRPNGLRISRVRVPLGVILIIYESRPNVTSECASLCLKSGNAVILRGGSEARHTNRAVSGMFRARLAAAGLPADACAMVSTQDRRAIDELLRLEGDVNLVIPRGGESLIRRIVARSRIPVIKHYKGICHVYVDKDADLAKALKVAFNAKCQRVSVCNAMETLLVHRNVARRFLPRYAHLLRQAGCEIRGDAAARRLIPGAKPATEEDWRTEYLDKILSIRVVPSLAEAVRHIETYGSHHTDSIITENRRSAEIFLKEVDSSSVMHNVSTRFSDGFQYGLGAEIGISTDKLHARGPMGLEGLTSYKFVVEGTGQVRT